MNTSSNQSLSFPSLTPLAIDLSPRADDAIRTPHTIHLSEAHAAIAFEALNASRKAPLEASSDGGSCVAAVPSLGVYLTFIYVHHLNRHDYRTTQSLCIFNHTVGCLYCKQLWRSFIFGNCDFTSVPFSVMGVTGAGKSTFIEKASGKTGAAGEKLQSCTDRVDIFKLQHLERSTHDIVFVDTPGFNHTNKSDRETYQIVRDWVEKHLTKRNLRPSVVLNLHHINYEKISGSSKTCLSVMKALFGEEDIIYVTTMWDEQVDCSALADKEQELLSLWTRTSSIDQTHTSSAKPKPLVLRHDNTEHSAWSIIESIIESRNMRFTAELRCELDDIRRTLSSTMAGQGVYVTLQNLMTRQQHVLNQLRRCSKVCETEQSKIRSLKKDYEDCRMASEDMVQFLKQFISIPRNLQRFTTVKSTTIIDPSIPESGNDHPPGTQPTQSTVSTTTKPLNSDPPSRRDSHSGGSTATEHNRAEPSFPEELIFALIGPQGSGKTSFINMLSPVQEDKWGHITQVLSRIEFPAMTKGPAISYSLTPQDSNLARLKLIYPEAKF
ncbi:hypothetical protein ONZ45_g11719 [Pleurotus djamor]|nr:hypothetical protein ONZ45_g11719 [Pleurotus djamor]